MTPLWLDVEFDADGLPADLCRHALNIELGLHKPETPGTEDDVSAKEDEAMDVEIRIQVVDEILLLFVQTKEQESNIGSADAADMATTLLSTDVVPG